MPGGAWADVTLLRHAFTNVLSNAVKYSAPGAPVDFTVQREEDDAVIRVRDYGIGIPLGDRARLFNAFYRGSNTEGRPGTGLGLVIVKRCVELHRGKIEIEHPPPAGTLVSVRLPLFAPKSETEILPRRAAAVE